MYILSSYFYGFKNSPYKINDLNVCKALFHIHGDTHPAPSCQTQKLAFHGFGLRAGPRGLIGQGSGTLYSPLALLGSSRLPLGFRSVPSGSVRLLLPEGERRRGRRTRPRLLLLLGPLSAWCFHFLLFRAVSGSLLSLLF